MRLATTAGLSWGFLVVLLSVAHAIAEAQCFRHATAQRQGGGTIADQPMDPLWIVSCLSFVAFEFIVLWRALAIQALTPVHVAAALSGCLLFALGTGLRCLAIKQLSVAFARPPFTGAPPTLSTQGVFQVVRHPSELGLLIMCGGLLLIPLEVGPMIVLVCGLLPMSLLRMHREERWLGALLGKTFSDYCHRVPQLLPSLAGCRSIASMIGARRIGRTWQD